MIKHCLAALETSQKWIHPATWVFIFYSSSFHPHFQAAPAPSPVI
jgi:hypothetical protein